MKNRTISPRGALLAVSVALTSVALAPAADKTDPSKPAYDSDKPTAAKPALKPSLTAKLDAGALANYIDQAIDQRLAADKVAPSPPADDAEFLRRAYLDLVGHIPTADQAAAFLDSKDAGKRAKLIDELLASEDYGKHMADVWKDLLVKRNTDNRFIQFEPLVAWLAKSFNDNTPWDKMVRDLLTAEGNQDENGAVTYFLANNTVDKMTDVTTKAFLGVQLQCAQCHNHPFTSWKQADYWGAADFFKQVELTGPRNPNRQDGVPGVMEGVGARGRKPQLPDSAKDVPAKFPGGEEVKLGAREKARPVFAQWMTSADNPYFSKAMVNRAWFQLFGRGIVNPVDDIGEANPPSHPQLFADLAYQFASNGFDLKQLYRTLCNTRAYQRTSKPTADNADSDAALYGHMAVKVMTPEQQFDSLYAVMAPGRDPRDAALPNALKEKPKGPRAQARDPRSQFVLFFENEDANDPTEFQQGIPQALRLMNGPQLNNAAVLKGIVRPDMTPEQVIERLFLTTLARRPTAQEQERVVQYVAQHKSEPHDGYEDVLWVLLNCSEFVMNH
jgi:hypothetical protein